MKFALIVCILSVPNFLLTCAYRINGPKPGNDGKVQKGSGSACPSGHSCPSDSICVVKKDGELNCICPSSGRESKSGVTCDALEFFDSSVTPNSEDESCDPEVAGCGENAECGVHNSQSICVCPGIGAVPKGQRCDISGADLAVNKDKSNSTRTSGEYRKLSASVCNDFPNWVDSYGDGCDWYELYDAVGCPEYGNMYVADSAPNDGCCHCGGGIQDTDHEEVFTVIFMADMENRYRNHHNDWCEKIASYIKNFGGTNTYFDTYPQIKVDPKLVIHGGDLSDVTWGWDFTADELFDLTYQQFYNANIPMISVLGNHDETNGIPHSEADMFVRKSFNKAESLSSDFSFDEILKDSISKNSYYVAKFKGVQIATVNDALESTGTQWSTFKSKLDTNKPALFFSHRPLGDQMREEAKLGTDLIDYISTFPNPNHYAGHDHVYYTENLGSFTSYVAPYLHKKEKKNDSGVYHPSGFLALLVSTTQGVLETKLIHYDYESVTGCWPDYSVCGVGTTCNRCCHSNRNALGTQCGGKKWDDGTLCGDGTTCEYCNNDFSYWYGKAFTACGSEPKWDDGTLCGVGTTCNACKNSYTYWYGKALTACGSEPKWGDGTRCLAGTSCNACKNSYSWWYGKAGHHCGYEPCWEYGTVCGTGTTCNSCCSGNGGAYCPWYYFGVCTCG